MVKPRSLREEVNDLRSILPEAELSLPRARRIETPRLVRDACD